MSTKVKKSNTRQQVTQLLATLTEKNREILERRFGIAGNSPETLESIGRSYGITRERVRQIQEYGLRKLSSESALQTLEPTFMTVEEFIESNSGVVCQEDLFESVVSSSDGPYLSLALRLMPNLIFVQETDDLYTRYALDRAYLTAAEGLLNRIHKRLAQRNSPLNLSNLLALAEGELSDDNPKMQAALQSVLRVSKRIQQGPFDDYGLRDWPSISPRGVRDKAYLVFERENRPLHFRELSDLIDNYFKNVSFSRKAHPQTVHNELIKDSRFVLIGRGLYALSGWGYKPGTVKDVIVQIFEEQGQPLTKDKVLELISRRRFVKPNTVFLNLQNKQFFTRKEDGRYYLS